MIGPNRVPLGNIVPMSPNLQRRSLQERGGLASNTGQPGRVCERGPVFFFSLFFFFCLLKPLSPFCATPTPTPTVL